MKRAVFGLYFYVFKVISSISLLVAYMLLDSFEQYILLVIDYTSKFSVFEIVVDFALHQSSFEINFDESTPYLLWSLDYRFKTLFSEETYCSVISISEQ
jgi:hypothetical protein